MSKRLRRAICWLVVCVLLLGGMPTAAEISVRAVDDAQSIIDGIVAYKQEKTGAASVQQWIEGELTAQAGVTAEWYVLALSQSGTYDFTDYITALQQYVADNTVYAASSRQKYALALLAAGDDGAYIAQTMNDSIGQQGVMSWIYGLHLLNNGCTAAEHTVASVKEKLLSLQLDDGGWAITGTVGNTDVTAMAIQALAPYYADEVAVETAIDKALTLLSQQQLSTGDYLSYGVGNPDSVAQVITALASLGIDCQTDSRFIKDGNTLFDGVRRYRLADGSFCHQQGGSVNEMATVQVLYAMVAYQRMHNGQPPLYLLDACADLVEPSPVTTTAAPTPSTSSATLSSTAEADSYGYKLWVSLGVAGVAMLSCAVLYLLKKCNLRNFLVILAAAAAVIAAVMLLEIQAPDDYYRDADTSKEAVVGTVTLTIRCDTLIGKSDATYIPADGTVLAETAWPIQTGDTVYDVLREAAAKHRLPLETNGAGESLYVEGINHMYEFAFGDLSGWLYRVNGAEPSLGCSAYLLSDGDVIEWLYTCQLGEDLKG